LCEVAAKALRPLALFETAELASRPQRCGDALIQAFWIASNDNSGGAL
jgi:hypothetical protein